MMVMTHTHTADDPWSNYYQLKTWQLYLYSYLYWWLNSFEFDPMRTSCSFSVQIVVDDWPIKTITRVSLSLRHWVEKEEEEEKTITSCKPPARNTKCDIISFSLRKTYVSPRRQSSSKKKKKIKNCPFLSSVRLVCKSFMMEMGCSFFAELAAFGGFSLSFSLLQQPSTRYEESKIQEEPGIVRILRGNDDEPQHTHTHRLPIRCCWIVIDPQQEKKKKNRTI